MSKNVTIVRPLRETELRTRKGEEKGRERMRENEREKGKKKGLDRKRGEREKFIHHDPRYFVDDVFYDILQL